MVAGMAEEYTDPSGNTAQFQAFVTNQQQDVEPPAKKSYGTLIAIIVVAVIVVGGLVWLAAS
jgi:hypothetical protein